jgi:NIMA (never in mitosis gene a)-related kinase
MSPEIWMNRPYDARSDVWALGCLVYELAMLSPPFLANDMAGLAAKVKTTTAPRISKHYSEDLQNLVASMLCEWGQREREGVGPARRVEGRG